MWPLQCQTLAIVARVAAEGFEQQPPPCGPVIEINDSCKDTMVAGMKRLFELADLLGLFLDHAPDNWMSIAEVGSGLYRSCDGLLGGVASEVVGPRLAQESGR